MFLPMRLLGASSDVSQSDTHASVTEVDPGIHGEFLFHCFEFPYRMPLSSTD
jgi:hypothetical protein